MSLINPKCAAVSAIAVLLYHVYPTRQQAGLLGTAVLASGVYIGLAWYDALYDCEQKSVASEWFTLYTWAKPPVGSVSNQYGGL